MQRVREISEIPNTRRTARRRQLLTLAEEPHSKLYSKLGRDKLFIFRLPPLNFASIQIHFCVSIAASHVFAPHQRSLIRVNVLVGVSQRRLAKSISLPANGRAISSELQVTERKLISAAYVTPFRVFRFHSLYFEGCEGIGIHLTIRQFVEQFADTVEGARKNISLSRAIRANNWRAVKQLIARSALPEAAAARRCYFHINYAKRLARSFWKRFENISRVMFTVNREEKIR